MDVETFFTQIRGKIIKLIVREIADPNSAKVQKTTWIRFVTDDEPEDQVDLAFNSKMASIFRSSDLDQIVDEMVTHMMEQIEYPALINSRFRFDQVLFLDINFHQLNLTRGSSYPPLPDWLARKRAIINPQNEDEECFKWAVIAAERVGMKDPQRISNLRKFSNNYDWSGLKFPMATKDIKVFEMNNNISVSILSVENREIYICRKGSKRDWEINLMLIHENDRTRYTAVKNLSRLLRSSNTKHKCKQYFCTNCLQGFMQELTRDQHQVYCEDNKTVRVEMLKAVELYDGQNQFRIPFIMCAADSEALLKPIESNNPDPNQPYSQSINQQIPSGYCVYSKFAYGEVKDPLATYRGMDCVEKFCDYIK